MQRPLSAKVGTNFADKRRSLGSGLKRRSYVLVFSDLIGNRARDPPACSIVPLNQLCYRGHGC
jgi:hypothetical protein